VTQYCHAEGDGGGDCATAEDTGKRSGSVRTQRGVIHGDGIGGLHGERKPLLGGKPVGGILRADAKAKPEYGSYQAALESSLSISPGRVEVRMTQTDVSAPPSTDPRITCRARGVSDEDSRLERAWEDALK
jgi:hypothetical protein